MAKSIYASANGLAQKVKKMYVGVNGLARKIKKGYVGVNGLARVFFSSSANPALVGEITPMIYNRSQAVGGSIGNYAIILGGATGSGISKQADVYDDDLVHSTVNPVSPPIYTGTYGGASANIGSQYCAFSGFQNSSSEGHAVVFDDELTSQNISNEWLDDGKNAAASVANKALFSGKIGSESVGVISIDSSLTVQLKNSYAPFHWKGTELPSYGFFQGGNTPGSSRGTNDTKVYDEQLTETSVPPTWSGHYGDTGVSKAGEYAVFVGGEVAPSAIDYSKDGQAINNDLTATAVADLYYLSGWMDEINYGSFGCGHLQDVAVFITRNYCRMYNAELTQLTPIRYPSEENMTYDETAVATAEIGDYMIIAGSHRAGVSSDYTNKAWALKA